MNNFVKQKFIEHFKSQIFLDPRYDAAFKWLLLDEKHPERLVHFLNSLLHLEGLDSITTATLRPSEQVNLIEGDKRIIYDIFCKSQRDESIIIEMQKSGDNCFKDRMLYYASVAIKQEIQSGQVLYDLPKIYVLAIMDFTFKDNLSHESIYRKTVKLLTLEDGSTFYDKLAFVYVELPKFKLKEEELVTDEEKWIYSLVNMKNLKERPQCLKGTIFEELYESAKICNIDSMNIDQIISKHLDQAIVNGELDYARQSGIDQGKEQGIVQGIEQGIEIGIQKGKIEEKLEVIESMLQNGMDWEIITKVTKLTQKEFAALKA